MSLTVNQLAAIAKLQQAILKLEEADALVQEALGDTDVCYDTHNRIQDIVYDLESDIDSIQASANFMAG